MKYQFQIPPTGWQREATPGNEPAFEPPRVVINQPIDNYRRIAVQLVKLDTGEVHVEDAWEEYLQKEGGDQYWVEGDALDINDIELIH